MPKIDRNSATFSFVPSEKIALKAAPEVSDPKAEGRRDTVAGAETNGGNVLVN